MKTKDLVDIVNEMDDETIEKTLVDAHIASTFYNERKRRGMTQKEFAKLLGTSQSTVSDIENSIMSFKINKLIEYAHKLGMVLHMELKRSEDVSINT